MGGDVGKKKKRCILRIFTKLLLPPAEECRMDLKLTGDLSFGLTGSTSSKDFQLEISIEVTSSFHGIAPPRHYSLTTCLLKGVHSISNVYPSLGKTLHF